MYKSLLFAPWLPPVAPSCGSLPWLPPVLHSSVAPLLHARWVVIQLDKPLKVRRQVGVAPLGEARGANANNNLRFRRQTSRVIYLVPHHGGIWTLCVGLSELEQEKLRGKFRLSGCINYLSPHSMGSSDKNDWVQRMQNLSISCALVCCILLGASAVVGIFGIIQRQISAVLITGVMYILASTFGLFCLTIMHFKRRTKKDCGVLDSQIIVSPKDYYNILLPS